MADVKKIADVLKDNIAKVFFSENDSLDLVLTALFCGGHVLLEDSPGVGKTVLARALAVSAGGTFQRVQCTPDLTPSDILGVSLFQPESGEFVYQPGPVMSHILLVDEINRASPRSQAALLEAMESGAVTIEGENRSLPDPFFVIATENPVEFEGTFPLPEAQKDRFFLTLNLGYPNLETELHILSSQERSGHPLDDLTSVLTPDELITVQKEIQNIAVSHSLKSKIYELVSATREHSLLDYGASPRASRALYLGIKALAAIRGKSEAGLEELEALALPVLRKRVGLNEESRMRRTSVEDIIQDLLTSSLEPEAV